MLNIPSEVQALFLDDSINKNFHVHFPNGEYRDLHNSDVVSESVRFTESLCSQQYLKFGLTEASQIEFECVNVPNIRGVVIQCAIEIDVSSLGDAWIEANTNAADSVLLNESGTALGAENGNAIGGTVYIEDSFLTPQVVHISDEFVGYRVPYGEFIVDSCPRNHGAMAHRRVTAYGRQIYEDAMQIYGVQKKSSMIINPQVYYDAYNLAKDSLIEITGYHQTPASGGFWNSASRTNQLWFNGVEYAEYSISVPYDETYPPVLIYAEFPESEYDDMGNSLFKKAAAVAPNGFIFGEEGYREGPTSQKCASCYGANFRPAISCKLGFNICYPTVIKSGQKYIIDARNLIKVYKTASAVESLIITIRIPIVWKATANAVWKRDSGADISVTNWPIETETNRVSSLDEMHVYYKILNDPYPDYSFDMVIENTLEFEEPYMGLYHTYGNAFSFREMLSGYYELCGIYGKQERNGTYSEQELVAQNPYSITPDMYSEAWWEEYDVQPIGTLEYEWDDGTDRQSGTMVLSNDGSVYSFANNYVLQHLLNPTETKIRNILQTYFVPKIGGVVFTPIDLDAVGLPFLESGDYVELTAQDGTTVDSYILERSISGIQSLRDSIASTGGEVIA